VTICAEQVLNRTTWDSALASLPRPHVLQTWEWGDFKSRWGWQPKRLLFEEDGQIVAAAQILRRQLPRIPLSVAYVPKGPVLDYDNTLRLHQLLSILEQQAKEQRSLFIKIDPDLWLNHGIADMSSPSDATSVLEIFAQHGWRPSAEQIQFRNTLIIDLTRNEDELLANMKAKTRYNIRLTSRRGVYTRSGHESDLRTFYHLYYETSQRDGFLIRPPAYYLDLWAEFLRDGRAHLLLAEVERETIAGLILFHFGQSAWYMYGASSSQHRNLMPNYLLQWEAIRRAKELGCTRYDMWGAPDRFEEDDPLWGVYRFKSGFGGETMLGIGAFDFSPLPRLYRVYTMTMPRVLTAMRRRHQPQL
jgi:peptidoglycan pentaglycine glycine transferase (the first glycine)